MAVIERRGKFLVAEPFFGSGPRLAVSRDRGVNVGDLVVVNAGVGRNGRRGGRATIARRIGRPDVARDVIEALMIDRGLRRSFDPAVEREAREAAASGSEHSSAGRRDLRSMPTFTIDPVSARDFDDAISAEREGEEAWRIWVHIADVSAFVEPRGLVDREAYRRGTSVYVPGSVEPMLPEALSNNACSLVPGQDRLAVTVEMRIDRDRVTSSAFHRSLIRSDERLDYDRVDRIFSGAERASEPWGEPLATARAAAAGLAARRAARAAITLESSEPDFSFDDEGHLIGAEEIAQTEAHRLIEHLMIAANEQVAGLLETRKVPTLYRVHEPPDGAAAERLVAQLASLGVPTPPVPRNAITQQQAAEIIGEASQLVEQWVSTRGHGRRALTSLVLRSLRQAYYDNRNLGHAGLQSPRYCHFTSPIRRYPDLICHRALLSTMTGDVPAPEASFVAGAGPITSAREREAMQTERSADDIALCFLLERELAASGWETEFDGEVVGLVGSGAFVAFGPELTFEGMLPVRRMRGDWWELNEEGTMLIGAHSGNALRLGDPVRVRVGGIEAPRGRVDLLPPPEED
ncbi:MAG TPA: RNB domain-containing ribonuclease [Solirubrobacteraceae bacterium]|nr:RNB domain-containing ribonuclease [Solirubrobacteraceae bacterium]